MIRKSLHLLIWAVIVLTATGCATSQKAMLKDADLSPIYESKHIGIFPGPDNVKSAAEAYAIVEQTIAETELIASYNQSGATRSNGDDEALGFIVNDRYTNWDLIIKTRVGGMTIFQTIVPPGGKIEHKLRWGKYVSIWSDGNRRYVDALKVLPSADVRVKINKGGKDVEVRGYWMTHLPQ